MWWSTDHSNDTQHTQKWVSASCQIQLDMSTSKAGNLPGTKPEFRLVPWKSKNYRWNLLSDSIWQETETHFSVCRLGLSALYCTYKEYIWSSCDHSNDTQQTQKWVSASCQIELDMSTSKTVNLPGTKPEFWLVSWQSDGYQWNILSDSNWQ